MNYIAKYIPRRGEPPAPPYYYTITDANDVNDAQRKADNMAKPKWICVSVISAH